MIVESFNDQVYFKTLSELLTIVKKYDLQENMLDLLSNKPANERVDYLYQVYEMVKMEAKRYNVQVIGSEVIGLIFEKAILDCLKYYLNCLEYH